MFKDTTPRIIDTASNIMFEYSDMFDVARIIKQYINQNVSREIADKEKDGMVKNYLKSSIGLHVVVKDKVAALDILWSNLPVEALDSAKIACVKAVLREYIKDDFTRSKSKLFNKIPDHL